MRIALVREAGGIGDIISCGGATRCLALEGHQVTVWCPENFVEVVKYLDGVWEARSLGPVGDLQKRRRSRDEVMNPNKYPYLKPVFDEGYDKVVDLYCPGFLYETTERGRLQYTRSQLFAAAAGVERIEGAVPVWRCADKELDQAEKITGSRNGYIACNLRGTCSNRVYPGGYANELLKRLLSLETQVVYGDVGNPHFKVPDGVQVVKQPFPVWAAIVSRASLVVCMDSSTMHLGAALSRPTVTIFTTTDPFPYVSIYGVVAVESSGRCKLPCNYSSLKGWDRNKCRPARCDRIQSVNPDRVMEKVEQCFQTM